MSTIHPHLSDWRESRLADWRAADLGERRSIVAPEMRHRSEAARPLVRTRTGLLIGAGHTPARSPDYACGISRPHRARCTLADRAVAWACGLGALTVAVLLVVEALP